MIRYAVLLDTVSIQHYIYSNRRLRENIGASFLVEKIFEGYLETMLKEVFPGYHIEFDHWKTHPDDVLIKDESVPWEVGYIGGGNALLLFQDEDSGQSFINQWSASLLVNAPGIVCAAAGMDFDLDNFAESKETLFIKLGENKNRFIPQTIIARHGITAECPNSGFSLETWNTSGHKERHEWVSSVLAAKIGGVSEATKQLEKEYKDILVVSGREHNYCFTDELDRLGQQTGEDSHIAIVHIDGNSMAKRFEETLELPDTRNLSVSVRNATRDSFRLLLEHIIDHFPNIQKVLGFNSLDQKAAYPSDDKKWILPLRPILMGGDDITFVANGKLGIYLAKCFMEYFSGREVSDGKPVSACAGIAITKTKFPFYRGYEIAEQLCAHAKANRREIDGGNQDFESSCWLDFHVALGGFSGHIEEIRQYHYTPGNKQLLFRPFRLGGKDKRNFHTFIETTGKFNSVLPKNKRMELREVLTRGEAAARSFALDLAARGIKLPVLPGYTPQDDLWWGQESPYFDMIELIEFYPSFEMETDRTEV